MQAVVDAERARLDARARFGEAGFPRGADAFFDEYRDIGEVLALWDGLVAAYPGVISREVVGQSVEGRDIYGYTISGAGDALTKPALVFNGTIHAREWISPMTVSYIGRELVEGYGSDNRITRLLDRTTFRIIPVLNPDGYVYTWEGERFWRKNRRDNGSNYGVDLNRNFAIAWGGGGSSGSTGSNTYRGPEPFSEPESRALRDYLLATPNRVFHIDFHSYSQLVLYPWSSTADLPEDVAALSALAEVYANAVRDETGARYVPQQGIDLYQASGTTKDWSYGEAGVFSFTVELRPASANFAPPPRVILPCARENFAAVLDLAESLGAGLIVDPTTLPQLAEAGLGGTEIALQMVSSLDRDLGGATVTLRSRVLGDDAFTESVARLEQGYYFASLAPALCGETIEYGVVAEWDDGETAAWPVADDALERVVASTVRRRFTDDMESDTGWMAGAPGDTAERGMWERGDPNGTSTYSEQIQPEDDRSFDGDSCWVTDNRVGQYVYSFDIHEGYTTLVSPRIDMSTAWDEAELRFWVWFTTSDSDDPLDVDVSADDGATWATIDQMRSRTDRWVEKRYPLPIPYARSDALRVRFVAYDEGFNSNVEAAIDDLEVRTIGCGANPADLAPPIGVLDVADLSAFVGAFVSQADPADLTEDGVIDLADIVAFIGYFTVGG